MAELPSRWRNGIAKAGRDVAKGVALPARYDALSASQRAIARVKAIHGQRFAVRWSDGDGDDSTISIRTADQAPADSFVCPEQTYQTAACATCGLCWNTKKRVAFLEH